MLPTSVDIYKRIAEITGESDELGHAQVSINVTNSGEAKSTIERLKGLKRKLKLLKRESALVRAEIRAVNPFDETSTFLSDLLGRHISQRLDNNARQAISFKKHTLTSFYKLAESAIDDFVLKIDGIIIQLDEYIMRNRS